MITTGTRLPAGSAQRSRKAQAVGAGRRALERNRGQINARIAALPATLMRRNVVCAAAAAAGVTLGQMVGQGRDRDVLRFRFAACWIMRQRGWSFPQIGQAMGGRDHSTVLNAFDVIVARLAAGDAQTMADVALVLDVLEGKPVGMVLVAGAAVAHPAPGAPIALDPISKGGRKRKPGPVPAEIAPVQIHGVVGPALERARQMRRMGGTLVSVAKVLGVEPAVLVLALGETPRREPEALARRAD